MLLVCAPNIWRMLPLVSPLKAHLEKVFVACFRETLTMRRRLAHPRHGHRVDDAAVYFDLTSQSCGRGSLALCSKKFKVALGDAIMCQGAKESRACLHP
jgi:hypothetical protein